MKDVVNEAYSKNDNELIKADESKEIIDFDVEGSTFYLAVEDKIFEGVTDVSKLHQNTQHSSPTLNEPLKAVEIQQKQKY